MNKVPPFPFPLGIIYCCDMESPVRHPYSPRNPPPLLPLGLFKDYKQIIELTSDKPPPPQKKGFLGAGFNAGIPDQADGVLGSGFTVNETTLEFGFGGVFGNQTVGIALVQDRTTGAVSLTVNGKVVAV